MVPNGLVWISNLFSDNLFPMQFEKQEPMDRRGVFKFMSKGDVVKAIGVLNSIFIFVKKAIIQARPF